MIFPISSRCASNADFGYGFCLLFLRSMAPPSRNAEIHQEKQTTQSKYIKPTDIAYRLYFSLYFLSVGEMRVMNFQSWITLDPYKNGIEIEKCNNSYIDDWMWMDNSSIQRRWIRNHSNAKIKSAHPIQINVERELEKSRERKGKI